jgi:hypothetical protein
MRGFIVAGVAYLVFASTSFRPNKIVRLPRDNYPWYEFITQVRYLTQASEPKWTASSARWGNLVFSTFLPHRDRLEFAQIKLALEQCGASPSEAASIFDQAIVALDTYQFPRRGCAGR